MLREHLHFAWRMLRKQPLFTTVAILTLGVAIGANTAVFTIVDAVFLKPLPYPSPERLATVSREIRRSGVVIASGDVGFSGHDWEALRDHAATVDSAVVAGRLSRVNLVVGDRARSVEQQRVSARYFGVLGVSPVVGREFTAEEDRPGGPAAVLLSHRLWQSAFGADAAVVGRRVVLRGVPATVVGVMPAAFRGIADVDVWTPLQPSVTGEGASENYNLLVRLRPGVTWPAATADVTAALASVRRPLPDDVTFVNGLVPLQQATTEEVRQPLVFLSAAVLLVLLVACVNLAGLLLARAGERTREIGTRLAIGADRRAVVMQMLAESAMLATAGGLLGIVVGVLGLAALQALATDTFAAWRDVALDGRAVAVTAGLTMATAGLFGLVPALQASRLDVQAALAEGGTRAIAGGAGGWPRRLLIVGEVALGVVLLVSAGLLTRSFAHLRGLPPGFDGAHLVAASASLQDARYEDTAAVVRLFDESLRRLRALPDVQSAAVGLGLPYERILNLGFNVMGAAGAEQGQMTTAVYVTPGYFETLRIPVERGRGIEDTDSAGGRQVVVVNREFVRRAFGDEPALGREVGLAGGPRTIVGIVGNVQQQGSLGTPEPLAEMPVAYVPAAQFAAMSLVHTWFAPNWVVRTAGPPESVEPAIRAAIERTDPQLAVASVRRMGEVRAAAISEQRLLMAVAVALSVAALVLAAIGIYALIASSVSERRRELGVRVALGASAGQAMRTVMLPGLLLTLVGVVIGSGLALGAAGLVRRLLWGVTPADPLTFVGVAAILLAVAGLASVVPALRVRRVDPVRLLIAD